MKEIRSLVLLLDLLGVWSLLQSQRRPKRQPKPGLGSRHDRETKLCLLVK
jgi:hypothetical protein